MMQRPKWGTEVALRWLETILAERFGHFFTLASRNGKTMVSLRDSKRFINITQTSEFQNPNSELAFANWRLFSDEGWVSVLGKKAIPAPGIHTIPSPLAESNIHGHTIHYDILGLTYWMLSRQEEVGRSDLDDHGRFPATASHAYKHGYLERPVVDEWLHILGQVIQRTWPQLEMKRHQFAVKVSHDVDHPSLYGFCSAGRLIRKIGADILKRRNLKSALLAPWVRLNTQQTLHPKDPYNTFEWIMDVSEKHGLMSAFYFICGGNSIQDAEYQPEHPSIRSLLRRVHDRGHEIGLHPSYDTYRNPQAIASEAKRLKRICADENIYQKHWGGRMHYLRWEHPITLYGWEQAGMSYVSSLGFADCAGFRCGTSFEYPAFDPVKQQALSLRIRPLIAMECSVISDRYMGLGYSKQALDTFLNFKEVCGRVNGQFTLLWHNSHFTNEQDRQIYQAIIACPPPKILP